MRNIIQISSMVMLICILAACASSSLKAPCDYQGHFCGAKTKINQW